MAKRRSKLRANLILSLISTLVCLLAIEIGLRVIAGMQAPVTLQELATRRHEFEGRETGLGHMVVASRNSRRIYEFIPHLDVLWYGHRVRINSDGFRDDEFRTPKPPDTIRIAVIGDSISFGWKVEKEDNYLERLEQYFNRYSAGPKFEVMNFAIPGYNSCMEREVLKTNALPLDPDLVLLQFCGNDTDLPNFLKLPESHWRLNRCYLWEFLSTRRLRRDEQENEVPILERAGLEFAPEIRIDGVPRYGGDEDRIPPELRPMVGEENCKAAIRDMGRLCEEKGIPHLFLLNLNIPGYYIKQRSALEDPKRKPFIEAAREVGFVIVDPTVSHLDFMKKHDIQSRDLWIDPYTMDSHPAPPRHALVAMEVARAILENDLLPATAIAKSKQPELLASLLQFADTLWERMQRPEVPRLSGKAVAIFPGNRKREEACLSAGWYVREIPVGDEFFRWCRPEAQLTLPPATRLLLEVGTEGPPELGPTNHKFILDGKSIPYRLTRRNGRAWFDVPIPEEAYKRAKPIQLTIKCTPMDISHIPPKDRRPLGLQVYWIVIEPI